MSASGGGGGSISGSSKSWRLVSSRSMTSAGIREPGRRELDDVRVAEGAHQLTLLRTGAARGICEDYYL